MGYSKSSHTKLKSYVVYPCYQMTLTHSYVITASQIGIVVVTSNSLRAYHSTGSPNLCTILPYWVLSSIKVIGPHGVSIFKFQVHWREKPSVFVPVIVT